jgi:myosin heavy chain 9/10/11/14
LSELQVSLASSTAAQSELREAVDAFRVKSESYRAKLEAAEIERVKVSRAEALCALPPFSLVPYSTDYIYIPVRQSMTDTGKARTALVAERDAAENKLKAAEVRIHELEARLEEEGREFSDMGVLRQRISEEMEDERKQYQKDLADRDFTADQTRKKYQGIVMLQLPVPHNNRLFSCAAELAQLSEGRCLTQRSACLSLAHLVFDRIAKSTRDNQQTS